ncbi:unnamed protein product [Peronospora farinosa]|uniref:Peptidase S33 tripeptidyl aminopeptidase-like C-terminal domain-containing protein n=1 Tax=Peronospora farinosa TaxID=134698 RepID=A0AAV0TF68_9STRA|nr:unnamed protein product [Peronospora farinosa]
MDQRGSGHSTRLDCVTMPINITGSPQGNSFEISQVPACAHELEKKYGDLASFSITSAATDVATFISGFTNGLNTIVCGLNFGTLIVERLIHLSPPEVTGYVLDGFAGMSGASRDKAPSYSAYDSNFGEVGDAFLELCGKISECSERFVSKSLPATLQDVITHFDENPKSTCAALVSDSNRDWSSEPASYILRRALSVILPDASMRTIIPPIVYRLNRCEPKDIDLLKPFFKIPRQPQLNSSDDSAFVSPLLKYLVNYSEMWEKPTPSIAKMTSQESAVCNKLDLGNYRGNGIIYEVDKYWNKSATIPPQASVLLLSGKLNPVTPHKYAESLMEALIVEKKELITFEYTAHDALVSVSFDQGKDNCGMEILLSYVTNDGDLELLDKSCVEEMPALNMTPNFITQLLLLNTNDPYDGMHDQGLIDDVISSFSPVENES